MKRTVMYWWTSTCLVLGIAATACAGPLMADPDAKPVRLPAGAKVRITVGKDTTWITGPVRPDGTVDYCAWVNTRLSEGVTRNNNAAVLLLQAVGPELLAEGTEAASLRRLGMAPLPAKGAYFQTLAQFLRTEPELAPKSEPEPPPRALTPEQKHTLAEMARNMPKEQVDAVRNYMLQKGTDAIDRAEEQRDKALAEPWREKQHPLLAAWLAINAKPLALAVAASKRSRYYLPVISAKDPPTLIDALVPRLAAIRDLGRALTARAMLQLGRGNIQAARADLMAVHRLARLMHRSGSLIGYLVGIATEQIACRAGQALATDGRLTAAQARVALADLSALTPLDTPVRVIDEGERLFGLDATMHFARQYLGGLARAFEGEDPPADWSRYQPQWDTVLRTFNHMYDRMIDGMQQKTYAQRVAADKALGEELENRIKGSKLFGLGHVKRNDPRGAMANLGAILFHRPNITKLVADLLVSVMFPSLGRVSVLHDRAVVQQDLTRTALALAAWRARKGAYPKRLAELAPAYLPAVPADRFTDKPLVYKPAGKGYLLYSVGEDLRDDGGEKNGQWGDEKKDDLAVRVP